MHDEPILERQRGRAANADFEALRKRALSARDGWWPVLVLDPISVRIVWFLTRHFPSVTPNQITLLSALCGLASAVAFWRESYAWGALLFFLHSLLDQVDGQLARGTGRTSRLGHATDVLFDLIIYLAMIGGLYMGHDGDVARETIGYALAALFGLHFALAVLLESPGLYDSARQESNGTLPSDAEDDTLMTSRVPWARLAPRIDEWLRSRRLMIPLLWPDRHLILFILGPLSGWILLAGAIALCLTTTSFAFKAWKLFHLSAVADMRE